MTRTGGDIHRSTEEGGKLEHIVLGRLAGDGALDVEHISSLQRVDALVVFATALGGEVAQAHIGSIGLVEPATITQVGIEGELVAIRTHLAEQARIGTDTQSGHHDIAMGGSAVVVALALMPVHAVVETQQQLGHHALTLAVPSAGHLVRQLGLDNHSHGVGDAQRHLCTHMHIRSEAGTSIAEINSSIGSHKSIETEHTVGVVAIGLGSEVGHPVESKTHLTLSTIVDGALDVALEIGTPCRSVGIPVGIAQSTNGTVGTACAQVTEMIGHAASNHDRGAAVVSISLLVAVGHIEIELHASLDAGDEVEFGKAECTGQEVVAIALQTRLDEEAHQAVGTPGGSE